MGYCIMHEISFSRGKIAHYPPFRSTWIVYVIQGWESSFEAYTIFTFVPCPVVWGRNSPPNVVTIYLQRCVNTIVLLLLLVLLKYVSVTGRTLYFQTNIDILKMRLVERGFDMACIPMDIFLIDLPAIRSWNKKFRSCGLDLDHFVHAIDDSANNHFLKVVLTYIIRYHVF